MKVQYLSTVKLPTSKAYGVTVTNTIQTLNEMGIESGFVSPHELTTLENRFTLRTLLSRIYVKLSESYPSQRVSFHLRRFLYSILVLPKIDPNTDVVWTRDPFVAFYTSLSRKQVKYVVEIHQSLNLFDQFALKYLLYSRQSIVAPISLSLEKQLHESHFKYPKSQIVLCPMGVPRGFYQNPVKKIFSAPLKIGFVGGFYSNGIDQGIFRLTEQIREINRRESFILATLTILGVETDLLEELKSEYKGMLDGGELKLFPRSSQSFILEKSADYDVGILPYPEGKFFANRFPLKVMEYAALGKPIIISATEGHENILTRDEAWFYDVLNIDSLRQCIFEICSKSELVFSRQELAFQKSKLFTYENRVNRILRVLSPK